MRCVFPIEALASITRAVNFGLVADEAPMGFRDTVQRMHQLNVFCVMDVAFDTGVTPVIGIGVDGDAICDPPDVVGAFIFRIGDCPSIAGFLD